MGLRQEKKEQTRRRLLAVASRLFHGQGFQETTVDEIAARAEVSRMTFFNYFAGKDALLEELALEWFGQHRALFEIMTGSEGTVGAAAPPDLDDRLEVIIEHRAFLKTIVLHTRLFNNFSTPYSSSAAVNDFIESHFQNRLRRVREAQRDKVIRGDIEAGEICHLYDAIRNDIVGRWLLDDDADGKTLKARFDAAMRVFQAGLGAN